MKLAQKFTFVFQDDGTVYTAEEDDDGTYIVTWDWPYPSSEDNFTTYEPTTVQSNIVNGYWRVREVIIGPKGPPTVLKLTAFGIDFELTEHDGCFQLFGGDSVIPVYTYTKDEIDGFVSDGTWSYREEPQQKGLPDVFTVENVLSAAVYVLKRNRPDGHYGIYYPGTAELINSMAYTKEEMTAWLSKGDWKMVEAPQYLDPSIEVPDPQCGCEMCQNVEVVDDFGINVLDLRQFCEDTGYVVEVDEDFYTVRNARDMYVVQGEENLTSVMAAVRTLERFKDRG